MARALRSILAAVAVTVWLAACAGERPTVFEARQRAVDRVPSLPQSVGIAEGSTRHVGSRAGADFYAGQHVRDGANCVIVTRGSMYASACATSARVVLLTPDFGEVVLDATGGFDVRAPGRLSRFVTVTRSG